MLIACRFLYVLFLALDACFRLKRQMISSEIKDPALGSGWAYVMETTPYRHYLLTVTDQNECQMSTCSGLAALDYANMKFLRGYSTTGVGMGVPQLYRPETRYWLIHDKSLASTTFNHASREDWAGSCGLYHPLGSGDARARVTTTPIEYLRSKYNGTNSCKQMGSATYRRASITLTCQWWKLLHKRLKELPPLVRISIVLKLFQFMIPKMHIHAHTLDCQVQFSLNLVSGPGARHATLDDHWNFWSWMKTLGLYPNKASQQEAFELFTLQQAERVPIWKKMVEDFETGTEKKNPYQMKITMCHLLGTYWYPVVVTVLRC
ncbi:hypothetical protein C8R45DRAFT_948522 [Mycena sanguinolenta]|nr:hypothetical protein C8R45DRAFT_948522 [Mycena sanguinolenta]